MTGIMDVIGFVVDAVFAYFYMRTSDTESEIPLLRKILGVILLLATYILYTRNPQYMIDGAILRYVIRAAIYFVYLVFVCRISPLVSVYQAALAAAICNVVHNVFLATGTNKLLTASVEFSGSRIVNILLAALIVYGLKSVCYLYVCKKLPLNGIRSVGMVRFAVLLVVVIISVYVKNLQTPITYRSEGGSAEASMYFIVVQLALFFLLVFFERYQRLQAERSAALVQSATAKALIQTVKTRQEAEDKERRIRHDLKNHMLTIRSMIIDGRSKNAESYIDNILEQTASRVVHFHTGNRLLDTLLEEKLGDAEKNDIQLSVVLDFSKGSYIDDFDLCVIMGNALDNAIESCIRVQNKEDRYINITGGERANQLIVSIANSRSSELRMAGRHLLTTKADAENHGFGLDNIRDAVEKYGGTIGIDSKNEKKFVLTLLFPVAATVSTDTMSEM